MSAQIKNAHAALKRYTYTCKKGTAIKKNLQVVDENRVRRRKNLPKKNLPKTERNVQKKK